MSGGSPRGRVPGPGVRGPERLGPVLDRLLRDLRVRERSREGALATAWGRVAGPDLALRTRPVAFRDGVLVVEVDGAALLQEVRGFRARELLAALHAEEGGRKVRDLRFVPVGGAPGA